MRNLLLSFLCLIMVACTPKQGAQLQRAVNGIELGTSYEEVGRQLDAKGVKYRKGTGTIGESIQSKVYDCEKMIFAGNEFDGVQFIFIEDQLKVVMLMTYGSQKDVNFRNFVEQYTNKYPDNITKKTSTDLELKDADTRISLGLSEYKELGMKVFSIVYSDNSVDNITNMMFKDI